MSWETVKAFCRRQTQSFGEKYRDESKTQDLETDGAIARVNQIGTVSASTAARMAKVSVLLDGVHQQLGAIQQDFVGLAGSSGEAMGDAGRDLLAAAKKLELVASDMKQKHEALNNQFNLVIGPLKKFSQEANQIESMAEDRKDKMLEFDFFRNKVAKLRANPPSDPARIPRNEGKLADWQRAYEEANLRVKKFAQTLTDNGGKALVGASSVLNLQIGKYFDEISRGTRVVLLSQGLGDRAASAMAAATSNAAVNAAQNIAPQAQQAAKNAMATGAASSPHFRPDPVQEGQNEFERAKSGPTDEFSSGGDAMPIRRRTQSNADDDPFRV